MLNQDVDRSIGIGTAGRIGRASEWCVGEPPAGRWDVSFGARVAEQVWRWLGWGGAVAEGAGQRLVMSGPRREGVRKAA